MDGGNSGTLYTGEYSSSITDNLGTTVDGDGIPTIALTGQGIGTSIIANPVLDEAANQSLAVSDVSYTFGDAVFTISDAFANITYELVDASGNSLSPQVIATQGATTTDLDLILLQANVPLGTPSTTYQVIAGVPGACRVILTDKPVLNLSTTDSDDDGVADVFDLDDDNDGILDAEEMVIIPSLTVVAGASGITIDSNNFTVTSAFIGNWNIGGIHSNDLGVSGENFSLNFQTDLSVSRYIVIGLNASGTDSTRHYSDIDYALYFNRNGVEIYENGSMKENLPSVTADSDIFSIERKGTAISYSKNGTVFYTSEIAANTFDY